MTETSIERLQGDTVCHVYTSERKFINKLRELQKNYPADVNIKFLDSDETYVNATVPYSWMKFVGPKKTLNLTEEQRQERAQRLVLQNNKRWSK